MTLAAWESLFNKGIYILWLEKFLIASTYLYEFKNEAMEKKTLLSKPFRNVSFLVKLEVEWYT